MNACANERGDALTVATQATPAAAAWGAVGAMTLCVALLISAEFMPVSLLTPIAKDLGASDGMAGQAISISGLFAVISSLLAATVGSRFDRRHVLTALTVMMLVSLVGVAMAPNFAFLMAARALLGLGIGGFWALSTATVMQLVPKQTLTKAMGVLYLGNAVATAFAAPIGSYLGALIGWRGVFWGLVPLAVITLAWQWLSLPSMSPKSPIPLRRVFGLLKRSHVQVAMAGLVLSFGGAFATFTYLRPFLETQVGATLPQLSLMLLGLGAAGFVGTAAASALVQRHLDGLLCLLPLALAAVTLGLLGASSTPWAVAALLVVWGGLNSAIPVAWFNWLAQGIHDEPEGGGGLMVAAIQLAIMLGASLGGLLLDHHSVLATFGAGAALLLLASVTVGRGHRLQPQAA